MYCTLALVQELKAVEERLVGEHDHVLREVLQHGDEAPLRVVPGLCAQPLLHRFQTLHHARDAELVVPCAYNT